MITATTSRPALAATAPAADDLPNFMRPQPVRPGGPNAAPAANVVAQAKLRFPDGFGQQGLLDVMAGPAMASHRTIDDAIGAARQLTVGRASLGIVKSPAGSFDIVELTVPDIISEVVPDWSAVRNVQLVLGPDPVIPRNIDELRQLKQPGGNSQLMSVWTRSGNTRWDAGQDGTFVLAFNHL